MHRHAPPSGVPFRLGLNIFTNCVLTVATFGVIVAVAILAGLTLQYAHDLPSTLEASIKAQLVALLASGVSNSNLSVSTSTTTGQKPYLCTNVLSSGALLNAKNWIILGDQFVSTGGGSVSPTYLSLLRSLIAIRQNSDINLIDMTLLASPSDLGAQLTALAGRQAFHTVLAQQEPTVIFISYGMQWLYTELSQLGDAAPIFTLYDRLVSVFAGNNSVVHSSFMTVVLILHPDPIYDGVLLPAALHACDVPFRPLNFPTTQDQLTHRSIVDSLRTIYSSLANQYQAVLIDVDQALGLYSWAHARTSESTTFSDCYLFNAFGHGMLADMMFACMSGQYYKAP